MGQGPGGTGTGGDLFGSSSSGAGGSSVDCDDDKTTGPYQWASAYGDAAGQYVQSLAVDSSGNVLVTGGFMGTVNFGGNALTSAGALDIFVAKFDAAGKHVWSKSFGTAKEQAPLAITTDATGNVYLAGYFVGDVNFGGGSLVAPGNLFEDAFVAKFDANGTYQWAKNFGDMGAQTARGLAVDASGNVIVVGDFQQVIDFGGGPLEAAGFDDIDVFVAKFNPAGGHIWSHRYGDGEDQSGEEVTVDASGNVLVTGFAKGSIDFGKGALTAVPMGSLAFVAKLDSMGSTTWATGYGSNARGLGIDVDASGGVAVSGAFKGSIDFGGGSLAGGGSNDTVFIAKFDAAGKHAWSNAFGAGSAQGASVAVDAKGKVIVGGAFTETIDLGGPKFTSAGGFDAFLAKFDSAGCHVWSRQFGNQAYQQISNVAVDSMGNIAAAGNLAGDADFGGGPVTAAGDDVFIAKFAP